MKRPHQRRQWHYRAFIIAAATWVGLVADNTTFAQINLQVENKTVESSATSVADFLDVFFNVTPGGTSPLLAGYEVVINFAPTEGVTFSLPLADFSGRVPVLLPGQSAFDTAGTNLSQGRIRVTATANPGFDQPIDALDGLIRIPFTVAPNTVALVPFTVDTGNTDLADSLGNPIAFTPINGTLTIIPEPSSILLSILGLSCVVVVAQRMRRQRTAA